MEEAVMHHQNSNVMQTRDGKDHETHKEEQVKRDEKGAY